MKLPLARLARHLERQTLEPVWAVYGDEPLLVLEAADAIRARARALGFEERLVFVAEANFSWERLSQEADSLSLFAARSLLSPGTRLPPRRKTYHRTQRPQAPALAHRAHRLRPARPHRQGRRDR